MPRSERDAQDPDGRGLDGDETATSTTSPDEAARVVDDFQQVDTDPRLDVAIGSLRFTESEDFPLLQMVLIRYFRDLGPSFGRRDVAFVKKYLRYGETVVEFNGLSDELREAFLHPARSTPMVNEALDTAFSPEEVRRLLGDLFNQINEQGEFSSEARAQREAEAARVVATPGELLNTYFLLRVNPLPGRLRSVSLPIWQPWAGSLVLMIVGVALWRYVAVPGFLEWLPLLLTVIGLLGLALTSVTMYTLRSQRLHPDQAHEREKARAAYLAKRAARSERNSRWGRFLGA